MPMGVRSKLMSEPFCSEDEDEEWVASCRDTEDTELSEPDLSNCEFNSESTDWTRSEEDMPRQPRTEDTPVRDEGRLPELLCDLWLLRRDPSGIV